VFRRIIAWAGLLCMLLPGLVAHQRMVAEADALLPAAAAYAASDGGTLASALLASMCQPGAARSDDSSSIPAVPGGPLIPCLACCCLAGHGVVLAVSPDSPDPRLEAPADRLRWHAKVSSIRERTSERPPVRGPPYPA
jgi:hypothetical protein